MTLASLERKTQQEVTVDISLIGISIQDSSQTFRITRAHTNAASARNHDHDFEWTKANARHTST